MSMVSSKVLVRALKWFCCVVATTLACNLIWPCNNSVFSRCTNYFSVSPSLASKPVRCNLNLHSSYLGASARVSTSRLTMWRTFLAITMVHVGSSTDTTLVVTTAAASCSISWLTAMLAVVARDVMCSMAASILESHVSTCELLVLKPMSNRCPAMAAW